MFYVRIACNQLKRSWVVLNLMKKYVYYHIEYVNGFEVTPVWL